jgi:hypothetical protein
MTRTLGDSKEAFAGESQAIEKYAALAKMAACGSVGFSRALGGRPLCGISGTKFVQG